MARSTGTFGMLLWVGLGLAPTAPALTIGLDFVTGPTTDAFGVGTTTADYSAYGFTGMSTLDIQQALLDAVIADYLAYPTFGLDPLSPLPDGMELNIDFALTTSTAAPLNGDMEYYFVAIGKKTGSQTFYGQACSACVRSTATASNGEIVGSILVDNIATLASLAASNEERIQLLAGTIAHEIGHTLSLDHTPGPAANPGASMFDIMATGTAPSNMPNSERVKDRAFGYDNFETLIDAVGTRADEGTPEPMTIWLSGVGIICLATIRRRR